MTESPSTAGSTDAEDAQWPNDHCDMCRLIFDTIAERIEALSEA